jgi:Flp pilus assembly protein TadG
MALLLPIMLALLSGMLDYGMLFNNSLNLRQGVRESARQGVVLTPPSGTCAAQSGYMAQLRCTTVAQVGAVNGTAYARVFYTTWATGQTLTVCSMIRSGAIVGLVPYPQGGWIQSRTDLSIEVPTPVPAGAKSAQDSLPAGKSWSGWCS